MNVGRVGGTLVFHHSQFEVGGHAEDGEEEEGTVHDNQHDGSSDLCQGSDNILHIHSHRYYNVTCRYRPSAYESKIPNKSPPRWSCSRLSRYEADME